MAGTFQLQALHSLHAWTLNFMQRCRMHLYVNDYTPAEDATIALFQEASFGGYQSQGFSNSWALAGFIGGDVSLAKADSLTFRVSGPPYNQVVYGYFLTDESGAYAGGERFAGVGVEMSADGIEVTVQARTTAQNAYKLPAGRAAPGRRTALPARPAAPEGRDE